jgi:hypothetical protein
MYALLHYNNIIGHGETRQDAIFFAKLEAKLCIQYTVRDCKQRSRPYDPFVPMLIPTSSTVYQAIKTNLDEANEKCLKGEFLVMHEEHKRNKFKSKLVTVNELSASIVKNPKVNSYSLVVAFEGLD